MDGWQLTAQGIEDLLSGDISDLDEDVLLALRVVQSYHTKELGPAPESDIEVAIRWYETLQTELTLLTMTLRGDLYMIIEDDEPTWGMTVQGARKLKMAAPDLDLSSYGLELEELLGD
jgi:hypothetical protein